MINDKKNVTKLTLILITGFIFWAVTNISSTVMSVTDGRSISLGILGQSEEYLEKNAPPEVVSVLPSLRNNQVPLFGEWLISSFYGDSLNYMSMAMGYSSYEPYSLRPLYPKLIALISEARLFLGEEDKFRVYSSSFYLMNMLFFFMSVILGVRLIGEYVQNSAVAVVLAVFSFLQLGYLKTLYAPMVDQPAVFMAILVVYLFVRGNLIWLAIASFLAVLTKDALIIFGILPGLALVFKRDFSMIGPCIAFLSTFILLRVFSGVDPLSMQYGWEISKGDIRFDYIIHHFGSVRGVFNWLTGLWFSFGPSLVLCFVLLVAKEVSSRDRFILWGLFLVSLFFIFAQVLLAGQVARTLTPASIVMVMVTLSMAFKYYSANITSAFDLFLGRKSVIEN